MLTILSFPSRHALAHVPTACVTACTSVLTGKQLTFIHICKGISYRHIKGFFFPKKSFWFNSKCYHLGIFQFISAFLSFTLLLLSLFNFAVLLVFLNLKPNIPKCEILKSNVEVIWGLIGITLFQRGGYLGSYRYYTVPLTRCLCRKPLLLNYHFAKFTSHLHHSFFHSTVANSCRSILHLCYRKFLRFGTGSVYIDLALKK